MIAEITAAIESAKTLGELLKAAQGLRNYNEFVTAIYEVNAKLMQAVTVALTAQEKQATLTQRIANLEQEIMKLKDWNREAEGYELAEIAPGTTVYCPKPSIQHGKPAHALCTHCFAQHQTSILQRSRIGQVLNCPHCKAEFHLNEPPGFRPMQKRMPGEDS